MISPTPDRMTAAVLPSPILLAARAAVEPPPLSGRHARACRQDNCAGRRDRLFLLRIPLVAHLDRDDRGWSEVGSDRPHEERGPGLRDGNAALRREAGPA